MAIYYGFLVLILMKFTVSIIQVAPTWVTSSYLQANSKKVINSDITGTTTGNTQTPTATIPFVTAFTVVPNLGYGISNYQGNPYIDQKVMTI
jgi:hypothetical protein